MDYKVNIHYRHWDLYSNVMNFDYNMMQMMINKLILYMCLKIWSLHVIIFIKYAENTSVAILLHSSVYI